MNHFEICYHLVGRDELTYQIHTHTTNTVEILHIISGSGTILLNDQLYPLTKGMICIIHSSELHCTNPDANTSYIRSRLTIEGEKLQDLLTVMELEHLGDSGIFLPINDMAGHHADRIFLGMSQKASTHQNIALLAELLCLIQAKYKVQYEAERSTVSDIMKFINRNVTDTITLETIANKFHLNKSYLCRMFKAKTDLTISGYILQQRLGFAKHALRYTKNNIATVALNSGFGSEAYFCRIFKERIGVTPKKYRNSHYSNSPNH